MLSRWANTNITKAFIRRNQKSFLTLNSNPQLRIFPPESNDYWKSEGVSIPEVGYQFEIQIPPRGRRKKAEQEPKTETTTDSLERCSA